MEIYFQFLVIGALLSLTYGSRNVTTELICPSDPACKTHSNASIANIAYSKAVGHKDTLHYLFSTVGLPTLLVAKTSKENDINLNISSLLSGDPARVKNSIWFTSKPDTVYSVVFTKLHEYDDPDDKAEFNSSDAPHWSVHSLSDLQWDDARIAFHSENNTINFTVSISQDQMPLNPSENASFSVMLKMSGSSVRSDIMPHLMLNANTSLLDVRLNNLRPQFNQSRYGLELALVTIRDKNTEHNVTQHKSLDDEHSPGVFRKMDWTTRGVKQKHGPFMQWKPVCYLNYEYNTRSASSAKSHDIKSVNMSDFTAMGATLLDAFFSDPHSEKVEVHAMNISYGLPGDKFYIHTNYTGWSFTVGLGSPPDDSLSITIIAIISVGLGLPVILLILGGVYVCIKRRRSSSDKLYVDITSEYAPIQ